MNYSSLSLLFLCAIGSIELSAKTVTIKISQFPSQNTTTPKSYTLRVGDQLDITFTSAAVAPSPNMILPQLPTVEDNVLHLNSQNPVKNSSGIPGAATTTTYSYTAQKIGAATISIYSGYAIPIPSESSTQTPQAPALTYNINVVAPSKNLQQNTQRSQTTSATLTAATHARITQAACSKDYMDPEKLAKTSPYVKSLKAQDIKQSYIVRYKDNPMEGYLVLEIPIKFIRDEKAAKSRGQLVGNVSGTNPYRYAYISKK